MSKQRTAVVALGGNAISMPGVPDTIANQFSHTREALRGVIELVRRDYRLVITHGNGPQVGNALLRVELARGKAPILPLGIIVADTEGGMGYMIEQCLQNVLLKAGLKRDVVSIVTQVVVDKDDPNLKNPTKFIGQFYTREEAKQLAAESGSQVKADGNRGWRRVVGSPIPLEIINRAAIKQLISSGTIVIAAGGGGVPVYREADGWYEGVDAVVDKDRASAVLARDVGAEELLILTATDKVALNFGKPNQRDLDRITMPEAKAFMTEGHFPPGSMGPKIEAAVTFLESGGERVVICALENLPLALDGKAGTLIVPK
ncbi:MAG: carbamate kinase [Calditrichaeota bacterium]|nr:carbamate kinase [Calditrichota bacterium]